MVILCCGAVCAMEIPFSTIPVKTDANLITNLVRIDPDDQKAETLPTKVWLWYDEENLYAEFEARIDSTFTLGQYCARDIGTSGDYLFLNIITNPDSYSNYFYLATPTGSLSDGTRDLNSGSSYDWDSSYSYTNSINDSVWSVVLKIPFKEMRFKASPPYKWKVKITRYNEHDKYYYACPYYSEKDPKEYYRKATEITMTSRIKSSSDWKFRPYFVKSYDLINKTDTFDPDNIGLDISFNPSTRTKLKASFNPDFTDVPPDDASDIYNNRYPTYYYENRFFFIEDIDAFGVSEDLFYTRNIVQPQLAVKFTGSQDIWTYGYLCAKDKEIIESGEQVNSDDFYQLMAVKRQKSNYLTHMSFGSRMNSGYYNHFIIGDWDYEFMPKMHIGSSHVYTIKHMDGDSASVVLDKNGLYQWIYLNLNPGNWSIYSSYSNVQKDVALDTGYFHDTGYECYNISSTWKSDTREKFFRKMTLLSNFGYANKLDSNRSFDSVGGGATFMVGFLPKFTSYVSLSRYCSVYQEKEHDTYSGVFNFSYSKWNVFSPSLALVSGKTIIYIRNETNDYYYVRGSIYSSIKRNLSWYASLTHYKYYYDRFDYQGEDWPVLHIELDDSYQIANASLDYNFSNQITSTTGLSISTYKTGSRIPTLTFYSNLRYEFKKDWFLYLGYKTGQTQDEPSTPNDLLGHFNRNSASAYLKLSATI